VREEDEFDTLLSHAWTVPTTAALIGWMAEPHNTAQSSARTNGCKMGKYRIYMLMETGHLFENSNIQTWLMHQAPFTTTLNNIQYKLQYQPNIQYSDRYMHYKKIEAKFYNR
jgi:hypothetical protein